MKKIITRLSPIILLVFSVIFGGLTNLTPAFADNTDVSQEGVEQILGEIPSTDDIVPLPDNLLEGIDDGGITPLPDDLLEDIDNGGIAPLPDDLLEGMDDYDETEPDNPDSDNIVNTCQDEGKGISWFLCATFEFSTNASDSIYNIIEDFLVIDPITTDRDSATHRVWDYIRGFTNIIFIIFLVIVIYSQITGLGINNYGIKRILPRLIIAVVLVNLSYIICALVVDISNVVGSGITSLFDKVITETGLSDTAENALFAVNWSDIYTALTVGGSALAAFTIGSGGLKAAFFTAVILIIGVVFSGLSGVITIGLRQVMVTLLIIISPLAFVAYLLPNTEKWYNKWKSLLAQMVFFYPIFATLFSASKLAGLTIIGSSNGDILKVIVGLAVQVLPLFLSISLFKMSGTILGKVSSGLDKAFGYTAKPLQGWALSHHEQNKQRYLARNIAPGARLRNYLAHKRTLREMNTLDNQEIVTNRTAESALNKRASYLGVDKDGNPIWGTKLGPVTWRNHANSYARAAARANAQKLATTAAQARLANSLSDHGSLFDDKSAAKISARAAESFKELTVQEFWRENIGQNDQEYLINEYLKAIDDRGKGNNYRYNRLIMGAAGSYGYKGEKTIIAQVVKRSADIEAKRRAEAAIVINKFGYTKEFRNMMFDRRYMNDNGFATDANGNEVEDENYRPLDGATVEKWHKYIYVDGRNHQIDRTKGDSMSDKQLEAKGIRKVRYADITDDNGNVVSHVYEDDAGYVKEMIMNDMLISDPIARRYATELGLPISKQKLLNDPVASQYAKENEDRGKGKIRRYHTSVESGYQGSGYNEHNAAYTSMLNAQLNGGNINTNGQLMLAELMSFNASGKVGKLLLNDGVYYNNARNFLSAFSNPAIFEKYLKDADVALYCDQNSEFLNGLRLSLDENGNPYWRKISHNDPGITLEDKKNFILHKVFPKYVKKILGALGRRPSPNVLDGMKPENVKPLLDLLHFAGQLGEQNVDPSIPFEQRLDGNDDLFENTDPNLFMSFVDEHRQRAAAIKQGLDPEEYKTQLKKLENIKKRARSASLDQAAEDLEDILFNKDLSDEAAYKHFADYCRENRNFSGYRFEIDELIERYRYGPPAGNNKAQVAHNLASDEGYTREDFVQEFRNRFL